MLVRPPRSARDPTWPLSGRRFELPTFAAPKHVELQGFGIFAGFGILHSLAEIKMFASSVLLVCQ